MNDPSGKSVLFSATNSRKIQKTRKTYKNRRSVKERTTQVICEIEGLLLTNLGLIAFKFLKEID